MIDAHHLPSSLQKLVVMTTGSQWPTGSEGLLRDRAADWDIVAAPLETCLQRVEEVRVAVAQGLDDAAARAIDDHLAQYTSAPGAVLPALVECCRSAATSLRDMANEVELLRVVVIGTLVVLAVQLFIDLTVLALFGGPAVAAAAIAATRVSLQVVIRRLVVGLVSRVLESVLAQVGFTLLGQVIELGQGHRSSLDGQSLRKAAINGAVGGAVGASAGLLVAAPRAGLRQLGTAVGADGTGLATRVGRQSASLAGYTGWGALTGVAEASAQDAVWGTSGSQEAGALNGGFNGAWGVRHAAMNPHDTASIAVSQQIENAVHHRYPGTPPRPAPVLDGPPVLPPLDLPGPGLDGVVPPRPEDSRD